jgi:hypothetical protein
MVVNNLLAGGFSGATALAACHPFDVARTRFILNFG